MTNEPPERAGRPRSDAASRLAALLAEIETEAQAASSAAPVDAPAEAVAPEPAEERSVKVDGTPPAAPGRPPVVPVVPAPAAPPPSGADRRVAAVPDRVQTALVDAGNWSATDTSAAPELVRVRRRGSKVRAVAFGVAVVVLAASVPVLGYAGSQAILHSKAGKVSDIKNDPTAPNYVSYVDPTPTALVIQRDADDVPTAITVVALGAGESGGSVLFVPLDTNLLKPALFIDRLRTAYTRAGDRSFQKQIGKLLNIGFSSVVNLDDASWTQLVGPVAPLTIQNPIALESGAVQFPAGPIQLQADQVAAYLAATAVGQDDLDRMERHQLVWQAWMEAISTSASPTPVPNTTTGLGPYVDVLAAGKASFATLAVTPAAVLAPDGATTFQADVTAMRTQVTDAVPAPTSPGLGDRYSVRVLNGVAGEPVPDEIVRRLVYNGAQINALGNAAVFGRKVTRIEYHDPNRLPAAMVVKYSLGGGRVVLNQASADTVDLVVTLGQDALDTVSASDDGGDAGD